MGKRKTEEKGKRCRNKRQSLQAENDGSKEMHRTRSLQTLLWAGVILIQMLVVGNLEVKAAGTEPDAGGQRTEKEAWLSQEEEEQAEKVIIRSGLYGRKEDCLAPKENYQAEDGTDFELVSWQIESVTVPARSRQVERKGTCSQMEGLSQVPECVTVEVWERGQKAEASCGLKGKRVIKEEWQDGFCFQVIFHRYDAGIYWLGDHLIYGNEEVPQLDGCEELLLEEIGASKEEYRILGIRWDGEPYEDEKGEICRKAEAFGQKLVRDYQLLYEGMAEFPAYRAWRVAAVYETAGRGVDAESEEDMAEPEREQVRLEESKPATAAMEEPISLWQRITQTLLITVAVGAVLFLGSLFLLAVLWLRKMFLPYQKEQKEKES